MEEVMSFLETNYLWVIIIVAVLIVTIIGYFADKKGIGKPKSKKENNQIDIKKDVVKISDVQETISNLDEDSKIIDEDYVNEIANNEIYNEVVEESNSFSSENTGENNKLEEAQNVDYDNHSAEVETDEYNNQSVETENIDYDNDAYDEYDLDRISKEMEENMNKEIVYDSSAQQTEEYVPESLEFDAEPKGYELKSLDFNEEPDEYSDLVKDESVPEKIEVPDSEPTETLNIDNDFNRLLNDFDDSTETIKYELPAIESIDSSDLTDDDDIWNF